MAIGICKNFLAFSSFFEKQRFEVVQRLPEAFLIFGYLEVFVGLSMLHYSLTKNLHPKECWTEHLGGLIGAGIGAYTAFFVFGGTRVLSQIFQNTLENVAVVLWTGSAVIGTIATVLLTRHYRRRFGNQQVEITGVRGT